MNPIKVLLRLVIVIGFFCLLIVPVNHPEYMNDPALIFGFVMGITFCASITWFAIR